MNKPITVVYEEFKQNLANVINNSGLHPFMIEPILQEFLNETRSVVQRQYQIDRMKYEQTLAEEAKEVLATNENVDMESSVKNDG